MLYIKQLRLPLNMLSLAVFLIMKILRVLKLLLNLHLFLYLDNGVMRFLKGQDIILLVFTCLCFSKYIL